MLELAAVNITHFADVALETYVKWHRKALKLAAMRARLSEAFHYEALALHSYTDLFALGHMLEDRARTKKLVEWASEGSPWVVQLKKSLAQTEGVLLGLVANFYHNAYNESSAAGDR